MHSMQMINYPMDTELLKGRCTNTDCGSFTRVTMGRALYKSAREGGRLTSKCFPTKEHPCKFLQQSNALEHKHMLGNSCSVGRHSK